MAIEKQGSMNPFCFDQVDIQRNARQYILYRPHFDNRNDSMDWPLSAKISEHIHLKENNCQKRKNKTGFRMLLIVASAY